MLGVSLRDRITNGQIRQRSGVQRHRKKSKNGTGQDTDQSRQNWKKTEGGLCPAVMIMMIFNY